MNGFVSVSPSALSRFIAVSKKWFVDNFSSTRYTTYEIEYFQSFSVFLKKIILAGYVWDCDQIFKPLEKSTDSRRSLICIQFEGSDFHLDTDGQSVRKENPKRK